MDKLEAALVLIQSAIEEKRKLEKIRTDHEALTKENGEHPLSDYWARYWKIENQFGATPKKAHVNDNLKVARRLLMEGRV